MPTWALWLSCTGLIFVRALIAAAESALYGTSDLRAKELVESNPRAGRRLFRLKTEREATAASIRVCMVLSGFLAAGMGAIGAPRVFDAARLSSDPWLGFGAPLAGVALVGLLASLIDVTARGLANAAPDMWALRLSGLVSIVVTFFYPPVRLAVALLNLAVRPFGGRVKFEAPPPPLEELEKLLEAQAAMHQVDKGAPQLIRSIFELTDKRCRDVMVPRTDAVSIELTTPPAEILRILAEESHSRLPVYKDDADRVVGILHTRDLIPLLQHPELIVLQDVIRPASFVPWVKPIGDLLRDMQQKHIHMSVVVDEYGGFMGVVTLEDILREIVGDIADEFTEPEHDIEKLPDGTWWVEASVETSELEERLGIPIPEGDYETLGGFLSSLAGALPDVNDRLIYKGWQFVVASKDGARLARIKVMRARANPPQLALQPSAIQAPSTGRAS